MRQTKHMGCGIKRYEECKPDKCEIIVTLFCRKKLFEIWFDFESKLDKDKPFFYIPKFGEVGITQTVTQIPIHWKRILIILKKQ